MLVRVRGIVAFPRMSLPIQVDEYSGHMVTQRPLSFTLGEHLSNHFGKRGGLLAEFCRDRPDFGGIAQWNTIDKEFLAIFEVFESTLPVGF